MKWPYLILLLSLVSCGSNQKPDRSDLLHQSAQVEQRLRMNLHSEPSSLDPRLVRDIPTVTTAKMFFDGLMRINLERQILPSIAERVVLSSDHKHYTFYLRQAYWSDGKPVTAYDFEYAWKRVLSPDFPAEYAHQLFMIKNGESAKKRIASLVDVGVTAEGPLKLTVELSEPNPYFLEVAASPVAYPIPLHVEMTNRSWASEQGEAFICNGPFQLKQWRHGSELEAVKNPLYWDAETVKLTTIVLTMIEDEHTELNMYENNELDWAGSPNSSIPPEALPSLKESTNAQNELHIAPVAGTFCYKFNTKVAPFDSVKMRKAFACAINRKSLIDNVLQSGQIVATSLLPPCMKTSS